MLPPLVFQPYLRPRIWGGTRLRDRLGRAVPDDQPYGESWELSALPEHDSRVADGPLAGRSLSNLWETRRAELIGSASPLYGGTRFPLLIKWLDCNALLSVQVHPDDAGAAQLLGEPCGKAEAWIFLESAPGSEAYFGVRPGTTPAEFSERMAAGTIAGCLNTIRPQPGDVVYVPPGSVHALGAGQLLLEIEQPSDATFRVFDWNRVGPDGRPRDLHREQSLACIDWDRPSPPTLEAESWPGLPADVRGETLVRTEAFCVHRVQSAAEFESPFAGELSVWTVFEGACELLSGETRRRLRLGDTLLLPASSPPARWQPITEPFTLVAATLPRP